MNKKQILKTIGQVLIDAGIYLLVFLAGSMVGGLYMMRWLTGG